MAFVLALAWGAVGCGLLGSRSAIVGGGSLRATPAGPSAVLRVLTPDDTRILARGSEWGVVRTQNPALRFAEILASAAREDAGIEVIPPHEVARALEDAGLEATLQPDAKQFGRMAQALGCKSYLTAEIVEWQFDYILFSSSATVDFYLACYRADNGGVVWDVQVSRKARGLSDREVARLALAEAFRWLKENEPPASFLGAQAETP